MQNYLNNRLYLKEKRKDLRKKSTAAEAILWLSLKNKQLCGKRFRRQFSIANYILDFYCHEEKLGIELDGSNHFTGFGSQYDQRRTEFLNKHGVRIIRFENDAVFKRHETVLEIIKENFIL